MCFYWMFFSLSFFLPHASVYFSPLGYCWKYKKNFILSTQKCLLKTLLKHNGWCCFSFISDHELLNPHKSSIVRKILHSWTSVMLLNTTDWSHEMLNLQVQSGVNGYFHKNSLWSWQFTVAVAFLPWHRCLPLDGSVASALLEWVMDIPELFWNQSMSTSCVCALCTHSELKSKLLLNLPFEMEQVRSSHDYDSNAQRLVVRISNTFMAEVACRAHLCYRYSSYLCWPSEQSTRLCAPTWANHSFSIPSTVAVAVSLWGTLIKFVFHEL